MRRFAIVAALLGGCIGADTAECPGGGVCPAGLECRLDRGAQVCVAATCGNGRMEAGESCDDGNNESGDLCPADCAAAPTCGNGAVDPGEDCDDGNRVSGDGCQATCRFPIRPPARHGCAMAYDSVRGRLVLFGGNADISGERLLEDLWEWDGVEWVEPDYPSRPPVGRQNAAMTFDAERGRIVMFGGAGTMGVPLGDRWEWDGTSWFERTEAGPPRLVGTSMAFDTNRNVAVLFGGMASNMQLSRETYEWTGIGWSGGFPYGPGARRGAAMAFDEGRDVMLLIGGVFDNVTWGWDGVEWRNLFIGDSPGYLVDAGMAYDRARDRVVLVGGQTPEGTVRTWETGQTSTVWFAPPELVGPPVRDRFGIAYVDSIQEVVVFGGRGDALYDDLWSYDGTTWRRRL